MTKNLLTKFRQKNESYEIEKQGKMIQEKYRYCSKMQRGT